jgi:hypothetical protein
MNSVSKNEAPLQPVFRYDVSKPKPVDLSPTSACGRVYPAFSYDPGPRVFQTAEDTDAPTIVLATREDEAEPE